MTTACKTIPNTGGDIVGPTLETTSTLSCTWSGVGVVKAYVAPNEQYENSQEWDLILCACEEDDTPTWMGEGHWIGPMVEIAISEIRKPEDGRVRE